MKKPARPDPETRARRIHFYHWLIAGCFAITAIIIGGGFLLVDESGPVWLKALIAIAAALPLLPGYAALKCLEDLHRQESRQDAGQRRQERLHRLRSRLRRATRTVDQPTQNY